MTKPRKRKPGRPPGTTRGGSNVVSFRVSDAKYADLCTEAKRLRVTANEVARRRAFPLEAVKSAEDAEGASTCQANTKATTPDILRMSRKQDDYS